MSFPDMDGNIYMPPKGSCFTGLNENLFAQIYPVTRVGDAYVPDKEQPIIVQAPMKNDGSIEFSPNWSSPFDAENMEAKKPLIMGMLQSGAVSRIFEAPLTDEQKNQYNSDKEKNAGIVNFMEGRTSVTKLNSTQTFGGMPPTTIPLTLLFKANMNAISEVVEPVKQLLKWTLPKKLSPDGRIEALIKASTDNSAGASPNDNKDTVSDKIKGGLAIGFPSLSPQLVGLKMGTRHFFPMVIEPFSMPVSPPIDSRGNAVVMEVSLTLRSLTAQDAADVDNFWRGG